MKLYREKYECLATDIMKRYKFTLKTPDTSLVSSQIWELNGKEYQFDGWESKPGTNQIANNAKYITMKRLKKRMVRNGSQISCIRDAKKLSRPMLKAVY